MIFQNAKLLSSIETKAIISEYGRLKINFFRLLDTFITTEYLSFHGDSKLLHIFCYENGVLKVRYAIKNSKNLIPIKNINNILDGINKNQITLNSNNVLDYVRFFMKFYEFKNKKLMLIETFENLVWQSDADEIVKDQLQDIISNYTLEVSEISGKYYIKSLVLASGDLQSYSIAVDIDGHIELDKEDTLISGLPVIQEKIISKRSDTIKNHLNALTLELKEKQSQSKQPTAEYSLRVGVGHVMFGYIEEGVELMVASMREATLITFPQLGAFSKNQGTFFCIAYFHLSNAHYLLGNLRASIDYLKKSNKLKEQYCIDARYDYEEKIYLYSEKFPSSKDIFYNEYFGSFGSHEKEYLEHKYKVEFQSSKNNEINFIEIEKDFLYRGLDKDISKKLKFSNAIVIHEIVKNIIDRNPIQSRSAGLYHTFAGCNFDEHTPISCIESQDEFHGFYICLEIRLVKSVRDICALFYHFISVLNTAEALELDFDENLKEISELPIAQLYRENARNYLENIKKNRKSNFLYASPVSLQVVDNDDISDINNLTLNAIDFLLCHEFGHIVLNHTTTVENFKSIDSESIYEIVGKKIPDFSEEEIMADTKAVMLFLGERFTHEKKVDFEGRGGLEMLLPAYYIAFITMSLLLKIDVEEADMIHRLKMVNNFTYVALEKKVAAKEFMEINNAVMAELWTSIIAVERSIKSTNDL